MQYLQQERRKHFRCSVPHSAFEYKGKLFDILNISAGGILVENKSSLSNSNENNNENIFDELLAKKFNFNLIDKSSNSTLLLEGSVARIIKNSDETIASFVVLFSSPF
ncbi:MAG: hypothetical protein HQK51_12160 [Oligoflexia bacterium]|nr:hypothetical protein [Oligoflexia bacterium]